MTTQRDANRLLRPLWLASILVAGCGAPEATAPAEPARPLRGTTVEGEGWPRRVTDSVGRSMVLEKPATRVVSLAPSNTEILFAIGAGDAVVGVTNVDDYPPEAKSRTSVGGMSAQTMSLEVLVSLKPDLVLATAGVQGPAIEPLERLGLAVVALDAERPEDVPANIRAVGRMVGAEAKAEEAASAFDARLEAVRSRVAARTGPRPKVLYLLYDTPLMTVGPATILGRMIEAAGGDNIFADVSQNYPTPSDEEVVLRRPEVVLATFGLMNGGDASPDRNRERLLNRPGWRSVPAIRDGRVFTLDEDLATRVGPRLVEGLEAMERALAPSP
ncbi:cobalamin-binding protein [Paludisphaera sp.]|uniref:ABC transporter substrate-binding protein n=1 Tax=Paludisphaera sp. TaxID=2017432 RepID=UPI00301C2D1E